MTVAIEVNEFLTDTPPDPLIKNGRYQIVDPETGKSKPHTRVTNFCKKLEDEFNLTMWKQRMVLLGTAHRSDIAVAALASDDDKTELNRLAESAMEAAKANVRRDTGSALHRLCERVDGGETLDLPEPWKADVEAYSALLAELRASVELIEEVVVYPQLGLAGRIDRTLLIDGTRFIADIKTGSDLSYSWGSIAIQLALYAGARTIYDPDAKKHCPMLECDQSRALVIHLPAGEGKAIPYWVNLEAGRRGIQLVTQVLTWRKATKEIAVRAVAPSFVARPELREYVAARMTYLIDAGHKKELAGTWPDGIPTLKGDYEHTEVELDLILDACDGIEGRHRMVFPDLTDPRAIKKF